jgi:hypothetical protein
VAKKYLSSKIRKRQTHCNNELVTCTHVDLFDETVAYMNEKQFALPKNLATLRGAALKRNKAKYINDFACARTEGCRQMNRKFLNALK